MRSYVAALTLAAFAALAAPARAGTPAPGFADTLVVGSLSSPTAAAFLPDGTLLITQKGGDLNLFNGSSTTTLVTIPVCTGSEMGLLGVAVDPSFTGSSGFIYLYRTTAPNCSTSTNRFNQVVRVTMSGGTVSLASLTVLLSGIVTDNGNHDGGALRIGPVDQKLYVGAGDSGNGDNVGGPGSATNPYAQSLTSLNGKILRLNLDGSAPSDNPFVGMGADRPEIWAYGFRNPFRIAFDGTTGKLWIGDVGDLTVEEIDIGVAGANYSWPRCEGNLQGPPGSPPPCMVGTDIAPVFTYPHSGGTSLGTCLIGGAFAGSAFGAMTGDYVFGDCTSSNIYHVALNAARDGFTGTPAQVSTSAGTPADFIPGSDGAIYYVAEGAGQVRRLAAASSATPTPTPTNTPGIAPINTFTRTPTPPPSATPAGATTATSTPGAVLHDSVVLRLRPKTYTIPAGKTLLTRTLLVSVVNADILPVPEPGGHTVQLNVSSTDCPVGMAGTPDFGRTALGPANVATILGGKYKRARVPLTITSSSFSIFNHKAPTRCTLTFTATVAGSSDPTPQNAVATVEINIIDENDPEGTARHESLIKSIAPARMVTLPVNAATRLRIVRPVAVNADILPFVETSADAITVVASDGDCPSGTVGVADYDAAMAGAQNTAQVTGGNAKVGVLPLTINASAFFSPNGKSPARCTAVLTASGPGGDTDGSNNTTKLVIDVIDRNDF